MGAPLGRAADTVDPVAAMALAGTLDTRRGDLLQRTPQVIRLDTRSDTLSFIFLDVTAKGPVP
ncbi:MAG TPA: hypothetical protein VK210_02215 [Terriglobia bacterium]|nr:hypothetical protein [Terriglobia bacterium]